MLPMVCDVTTLVTFKIYRGEILLSTTKTSKQNMLPMDQNKFNHMYWNFGITGFTCEIKNNTWNV